MALTRITSGVISANVVTSEKLQNSIIQARHIQAGALTTDLFEESGNAAAVEIRVNANVDIVQDNVVATQANVDILQDNVNTTTSNIATLTASINTIYANVNTVQDNVTTNVLNIDQVQSNVDIISSNLNGVIDGTIPFTGPVTMQDTLTVQGNLIVVGAQVDLGVSSAQITDATLLLAANTPADEGLPADSGILINRGANDNVFFGFASYADHIDFIFTEAPADNVQHFPTAYIDVHANSFGAEGVHDATFTAFHHADYPTTGIYMPAGQETIKFAAGGVDVASVTSSGNLFLYTGIIHASPSTANTLDLDDDELGDRENSITLRSLQSFGIFIDSNDSEDNNFFNIYDGEDDPNAVGKDDGIFSVRDDGNVFVSHDINIVGNANVAGVNLLSNDYVTYTRLTANLNSTNDNIALVTGNVNAVQDNVTALTGGGTLSVPFTNTNTSVGTSNVFFVGSNIANQSNIVVVSLDGIVQTTLDYVPNFSNDTVQFTDASIPAGIVFYVQTLTPASA